LFKNILIIFKKEEAAIPPHPQGNGVSLPQPRMKIDSHGFECYMGGTFNPDIRVIKDFILDAVTKSVKKRIIDLYNKGINMSEKPAIYAYETKYKTVGELDFCLGTKKKRVNKPIAFDGLHEGRDLDAIAKTLASELYKISGDNTRLLLCDSDKRKYFQ
jgi:hypothetical protein